jgi:C-terminal processing protease CtpA/Prc
LEGVAITDRRGEFRLRDVTPGPVVLEAYAADKGRGRSSEFSVARGQTTRDVVIKLQKEAGASAAEFAGGGVAVTLGETNDDSVVVVAVARGSEAERAGVAAGDEIEAVDGAPVETMADARKRLAGPVGVDAVVRITREGAAVTLRIPREPLRK